MKHIFWVIPGQLCGRPGPDDEPWEVAELWSGGIDAVLSVNDGALCKPEEFAAAGIAYACFPLSDWVPPQPGDADHCLQVLPVASAFVQAQLDAGRTVLVHCSGGNDRTGLFLAYFLAHDTGASARDSVKAVRAVRPTALSADGWETFAQDLIERSTMHTI